MCSWARCDCLDNFKFFLVDSETISGTRWGPVGFSRLQTVFCLVACEEGAPRVWGLTASSRTKPTQEKSHLGAHNVTTSPPRSHYEAQHTCIAPTADIHFICQVTVLTMFAKSVTVPHDRSLLGKMPHTSACATARTPAKRKQKHKQNMSNHKQKPNET